MSEPIMTVFLSKSLSNWPLPSLKSALEPV